MELIDIDSVIDRSFISLTHVCLSFLICDREPLIFNSFIFSWVFVQKLWTSGVCDRTLFIRFLIFNPRSGVLWSLTNV